ncbi:hypothetical protein B7463_g1635, partial [Scytalidium lignicola]
METFGYIRRAAGAFPADLTRESDFYTVNDTKVGKTIIKNVFGTQSNEFHAKSMRPIAKFYKMSSLLLTQQPNVENTIDLLCKRLNEEFIDGPNTGKVCQMDRWLLFFTWDVLAQLSFSKPMGFLEKGHDDSGLLETADKALDYFAVIGQIPELDHWLAKNPFMPIGPPSFDSTAVLATQIYTARVQGTDGHDPHQQRDMLDDFIDVKNSNPELLDDGGIVGAVLVNLMAGADTTAILLRSFMYYVLKNPKVYKKLQKELDGAGLKFPVAYDDSIKLPYLNAVISEVGRVHPGVGLLLERIVPQGGLALPDGRVIPAGTIVGMNPWVIHHNKKIFGEDAESFNPDRWLQQVDEGETEEEHKARITLMKQADLTFGAGNRICLGRHISLLEAFKLVPTLFLKYEFEFENPEKVWHVQNSCAGPVLAPVRRSYSFPAEFAEAPVAFPLQGTVQKLSVSQNGSRHRPRDYTVLRPVHKVAIFFFLILPLVESCLCDADISAERYGQKLVRRCQNYRHAEAAAQELMISIEHNWMKTEAQINFLKRISTTLDPVYCDVQSRVLSQLEGKLKTATLTMDQLILHEKKEKEETEQKQEFDMKTMTKALEKMASRKKVKYAFKKENLEAIRDDLENWQNRFDPSWILTMLITDSLVDEQLKQEEKKPQHTKFIMAAKGVRDAARESISVSNPRDGGIFKPNTILSLNETPIPFSSALLCQLSGSEDRVLVDTMICNAIADMNRTMRDVRKLAHILSQVEPSTFGLLTCIGVVKPSISTSKEQPQEQANAKLSTFKFLFSIPHSLARPKSLRALLIESNPWYSLESRYNLAKQLVNSILYIHSSQFVHKNIRPETTIIFEKEGKATGSELGVSFLVGFENFRPAEGMTYRTGDGIWQHDLYRHPTRQGTRPEEEYQMQHDIYSLGVVLLEIGLWKSFISYGSQSSHSVPPSFSPTNGAKPESVSNSLHENNPIPPAFVTEQQGEKDTRKRATAIKDRLVLLALEKLPAKMGNKYTDIVLLCLRCLDRENWSSAVEIEGARENRGERGGFGDVDMLDEDGIVVGVKYIERILLKVQEISV